MMVALLVICLILSLAASIWALVIIFRRSVIGGLLSLFFGLPMLYFLVTGWGKEGEDIRAPFFLCVLLYGLATAVGISLASKAAKEAMELEAPAARTPSLRDTPPAADSFRIRDTPAPQAPMPRMETARPAQEQPRRQKRAQSDCVYKPVMTDEDIAKCR